MWRCPAPAWRRSSRHSSFTAALASRRQRSLTAWASGCSRTMVPWGRVWLQRRSYNIAPLRTRS
eukprot:440754-Lingulodinium_polyedra.AAC.1